MRKSREKAAKRVYPMPIATEQRTCFGISWFTTEKDANLYSDDVQREGRTYVGG